MDGEIISAPFQSCCQCKAPGERFRMNTNFIKLIPGTCEIDPVDDERNFTVACVPCRVDIEEYWADMWQEYYSSRF